ncbi:MAG: site-specific DNA-methyltransferase [Anaerolineae bacterium]|nr:site-specific DNA-methyltransferase [Anaerolineae bacterium]
MVHSGKQRAPRNRTIILSEEEHRAYQQRLKRLTGPVTLAEVIDTTICQDVFEVLDWLPSSSVDLLFADSPYNLTKSFNGNTFSEVSLAEYEEWLDTWMSKVTHLLKDTASVYICGDWRSSAAIHRVAEKYLIIRNRITWEREKGRGAKTNWKNSSEDIWFCTVSDGYTFNVEDVKLKRQIIAPYTDDKGQPKDWIDEREGRFRLTHPSNLWTDLTVPFWSMPENTDHPTQKPEKLLAKIILASSNESDVVLDPFLGSGTTSVVARKLGRSYIGVEIDEEYCCIAEKRLDMATQDDSIQGYSNGVFWERNTLAVQKRGQKARSSITPSQPALFPEQGKTPS